MFQNLREKFETDGTSVSEISTSTLIEISKLDEVDLDQVRII